MTHEGETMADRRTPTGKLDQVREWPHGTTDRINIWARETLGFTFPAWQLDIMRQFEAPKPLTLADMPPEERVACQWMQATFTKSHHEHIITQVFGNKTRLLRKADGAMFEVHHDEVIPHPDLPPLEWPAGVSSAVDTPPNALSTIEDYRNAPTGTLVTDPFFQYEKDDDGSWGNAVFGGTTHESMSAVKRRVRRWGRGDGQ